MSHPFQIAFILKQHTPIIHFQHNQEGATLRASEVKPKLDRFIIQTIKDSLERIPDIWYSAKEKGALDYKLKIEPCRTQNIVIGNRMVSGEPSQSDVLKDYGYDSVENSGYFAQEKEIGDLFNNSKFISYNNKLVNSFSAKDDFDAKIRALKTIGLFTNDSITLKIVCFNPDLKSVIENNLAAFFICHNFGTRQTKGFGCFLPKGITDEDIVTRLRRSHTIKGVFKINDTSDFKSKLAKINKEYSLLKRGDSFNGYTKSKLWEYLCAHSKVNWEKRALKLRINEEDPELFVQLKTDFKKRIHSSGHHIDTCNPQSPYYYIRALLGLAEQYEFAKNTGNRIKVKIEDALLFAQSDSLKSKAIDRFSSPIRYFITDSAIYITTTTIPNDLFYYYDDNNILKERHFRFDIHGLKGNNKLELPVPTGFSLEKFIEDKAQYGKNLK